MPNAVHIKADSAMCSLEITPSLRDAIVEWLSTHSTANQDYMLHEHVLAELKFAVFVAQRGSQPPYYTANLLTTELVFLMRALRHAVKEWRNSTSRSGGAPRFAERHSSEIQRIRGLVRVAEQLANTIDKCSNEVTHP